MFNYFAVFFQNKISFQILYSLPCLTSIHLIDMCHVIVNTTTDNVNTSSVIGWCLFYSSIKACALMFMLWVLHALNWKGNVYLIICNHVKFRKICNQTQMLARYFIIEPIWAILCVCFCICNVYYTIACMRFHLVTFNNLVHPNFAWNLIMFCNTCVSRKSAINWYHG